MAADVSSDPVRYGVIGTGMMGCEHLLDLTALDDAVVVAAADPHHTSREWARACVGDTPVDITEDHRDLLARDDLDAVVIAAPNHTHVDLLADALATDLHVMVEKPLCTTVADCRRVETMAEQRDALCWVALEYRYIPTVDRFVRAVAGGAAGRLRMLSIREHRFPFLPKVGDWNRLTANTGGTLVEKCCHFFDLMNLVVGVRPVRVYASGGQDVNHLDEMVELSDGRTVRPDILDNAFVVVDYADGTRAALDLCMFAEGGRHEQELVAVGDRAKVETTVPGDRVRVGPRDTTPPEELEATLHPSVAYEGFHHGSSFREHQEFIAAIREGRPAAVGVVEGLWSVAVGEAAHRSIDEGRPIRLDELGLR